MTMERVEQIRKRLEDAFDPQHLLVKDQSHLHAGHAGAQDGRGHFDITIVSDVFADKSRIERHRMVYGAVGDLMETDIHALAINARTLAER